MSGAGVKSVGDLDANVAAILGLSADAFRGRPNLSRRARVHVGNNISGYVAGVVACCTVLLSFALIGGWTVGAPDETGNKRASAVIARPMGSDTTQGKATPASGPVLTIPLGPPRPQVTAAAAPVPPSHPIAYFGRSVKASGDVRVARTGVQSRARPAERLASARGVGRNERSAVVRRSRTARKTYSPREQIKTRQEPTAREYLASAEQSRSVPTRVPSERRAAIDALMALRRQ